MFYSQIGQALNVSPSLARKAAMLREPSRGQRT